MRVRTLSLATAIVTSTSLALTGCGRDPAALHGSDRVGVTVLPVDERVEMPDITGVTLDGEQISLAQLRGKPVVLNAWASWCEPCRSELPMFAKAEKALGDQVSFLGVDVTDEPAAATQLLKETGIEYPSLVDEDGAILASLPGVPPKAVPSTLILDSQGRIAVRVIGAVKGDQLEGLIAEAS